MAARGLLQKKMWMQKLKLKVRNYSNFTITFSTIWRCAGEFFKLLLKFKKAATDQLQFIFFSTKTLKLQVKDYTHFTITFPTIWRCAGDFFEGFTKIQNGRHG